MSAVALLTDCGCWCVLAWCFAALRENGWKIESNGRRIEHNRRMVAEIRRRLDAWASA